jgi:cytidylate kinase
MSRVPVVIAIDGTAACGKGTLARRLARYFGFAHLDSGMLYRLTALAVLESGGDPGNETDALKGAHAIDLSRGNDPAIRTDVVGSAASKVAAQKSVRAALLQFQQDFARQPPDNAPGVVIDGRDIGTVICPEAQAKLFVDARPEVRAHRRWLELKGMGVEREEAKVLAELLARDEADRNRPVSPLKRASDAALLDTSDLGIDAAFAAALDLIEPKVKQALAARQRD